MIKSADRTYNPLNDPEVINNVIEALTAEDGLIATAKETIKMSQEEIDDKQTAVDEAAGQGVTIDISD